MGKVTFNLENGQEITMDVATDEFTYTLTTLGWKRKGYYKNLKTNEIVEYIYDDSRCVAMSNDLEYLKLIAEENSSDIHEGVYQYIVIEKFHHHLYPIGEQVKWYTWIPEEGGTKYDGHYEQCDKPEEYGSMCNWGMG